MNLKDKYELSMVNILKRMIQVKKAEKLSSTELIDLQQERFRKLLYHVLNNSKFYNNYYKEYGIDVSNIDKIKIEELPFIDKQIMMKNYNDFVCDKSIIKEELEVLFSTNENSTSRFKDKYEAIHTSGSSGVPGFFVYGPNDWAILKALVLTRVSKNKINPIKKIKLAFLGFIDGHYAGITLARDAPTALFDFLPININIPLEESVKLLNEYQPDSLSGYANGVYSLALEQIKGNLNIKPSRILSSPEPLSEHMAETIYKAFGVKPCNFYAATESIGMAAQCDSDIGLHLFNDWHIFEVIKDNGEIAGPGEIGDLVITTLYNYTQPLIRYRMNDKVMLSTDLCKCEWSFPKISMIFGRVEELLWFKDKNNNDECLHPGFFIEFYVPGLEKFQVVQIERNKLQLNVVINGNKENAIMNINNKMKEILQKKNIFEVVKFDINIVEEISNNKSTGKYKIVLPLNEMDGDI